MSHNSNNKRPGDDGLSSIDNERIPKKAKAPAKSFSLKNILQKKNPQKVEQMKRQGALQKERKAAAETARRDEEARRHAAEKAKQAIWKSHQENKVDNEFILGDQKIILQDYTSELEAVTQNNLGAGLAMQGHSVPMET